MAARVANSFSVDDDNGSIILSDAESVSSIASSTTGRSRRRWPRKRNERNRKQTDKNLFGPKLTVQELNHIRKNERNPAVALRARKHVLETLLLQDDLGNEMMTGLLDVLLSVSKTGDDDVKEVYRFLAKRQFLKVHLLLHVLRCRMNNSLSSGENDLLKVISLLMDFQRFRMGSAESIRMVASMIHDTIRYGLDVPNMKRYSSGLKDVIRMITHKESDEEVQIKDISNIPIFPTAGEVVDLEIPELNDALSNESHSVKSFLGCYYSLLREDIVQPLREVISKYHRVKREQGLQAAKRRCQIIDGVRLHEVITTHISKGLTLRVQFDTSFLENVSWETTKILSFGSMVCLTNNHFHDMIFATVVKRDPKGLKQGFVDLRLYSLEYTKLLLSGVHFYMVDSRKCVEESYEVLDAMCQIDSDSFPFVQHVVFQVAENECPLHLRKDPDVKYDVGPLMKEERATRRSKPRTWQTSLLNQENWPPTEQLCVDEHQLAAIQAALSKQLTVITGAPGTGKTYVGLKLIQLFILNKHRLGCTLHSPLGENDGGPLLFMSASEATLDEYLSSVSFFQRSGIVRWAGQHTRKALQEYQMGTLREQHFAMTAHVIQSYNEKLETCKKRLMKVQANVANLKSKVFTEEVLIMVMDERHYHNLQAKKGAKASAEILEWLLSSIIYGDDLRKLQEDASNQSRLTGQSGDEGAWLEQNLPFVLDSQATRLPDQTRKFVSGQLSSKDKMTEPEVKKVEDVRRLTMKDRWRIYRFWIAQLEARAHTRSIAIIREMDQIRLDCQKVRDTVDDSILYVASVVGMTASSAAKNHKTLQRINPRVIIIEEGADILQSITSGVIPSGCQQLIIIGENVPKVYQYQAVLEMAKRHGIHASLMQQLVDSNYSVYELKTQYRMSPIASKLSRQLFSYDYQSDQSVIDLPGITGFQHNVFFIEHNVETSAANHEASFLLALFRHLLGQGFTRTQISILVTFPSQFNLFGSDMKDRLLTVDNFRGGKDIVLFMCNASEKEGRLGCLLRDQRIVNVLNCARRGLYIIGNFTFLSSQSSMWARILTEARRLEWVDSCLKLTCPHHPADPITVSSVDGFQRFKENGGCALPCQVRLDCGHGCKEPCHDHDQATVVCRQPCSKSICDNGHKCTRTCSEPCETQCREKIDKQLSCGHYQRLPCHLPPSHATCRDKCQRSLSCGHKCTGICGKPCKKEICTEKTTRSDWPCGHTVEVSCCDGPETCPEPCNIVLACGHPCSGTCGKCRRGRLHVVCQQPCGRTLVCGHSCESNCAAQCPPCTKQCKNRCQHSECPKYCGEACIPCKEPCLWRCSHASCPKLCGEPCDRKPCDQPCDKNLPCGHPCIGMCGEKCPTKCRVCDKDEVTEILFGSEDEEDARFVQLEDCGHVIEVESLDQFMSMTPDSNDDITIQLKGCPKCKTPIRRNLRYGNIIKQTLGDVENVKTKMRGDKAEIDRKMEELRVKVFELRGHKAYLNRFIDDRDLRKLQENLTQMKHLEKILARINRCAFLRAIVDVQVKLTDMSTHVFLLKTRKQTMESRLRELKNEVVRGELDKFTDQQMNDLQREISRVNLQFQVLTALTRNMAMVSCSLQSSHLKAFDNVVNKETPFTNQDEVQASRLLRQIKKEMGHVVLAITDEERVEIVKAIGLSQGHWYKCPKGHVYAIGECGGAMEETNCPECGATIGGGSHRLTAGNRVASEMDGARQAAWPTGDFGYDDYQDQVDEEVPFQQEMEFDQDDVEEQFEIERQIREDREREERVRLERVRYEQEERLRVARERREIDARILEQQRQFRREQAAREQRMRLAVEAMDLAERERREREARILEQQRQDQREQAAREERMRLETERCTREARERMERERREREARELERQRQERLQEQREQQDRYVRQFMVNTDPETQRRLQAEKDKCIIS